MRCSTIQDTTLWNCSRTVVSHDAHAMFDDSGHDFVELFAYGCFDDAHAMFDDS